MRQNRKITMKLFDFILMLDCSISELSMFWEKSGQKNLYASLRLQKNEKIAKNLILFLGDGMGMTTVTSTRIYKGQKKSRNGEDELLTFDEFPYVSLSKV
ncbi:alkaline phosphatase, tissue-nonspecific isozyme [Nephila pilipes]|uniref:alkaline phosphatase n=1 Tax=Nephila pilipes TaxID=299642 RepID=A0A8X6Q3Z5_NEPPI|nr:alkaline phosphatase, tissue-nonspecific isozyme [Nephila pilipes]